MKKVIFITLKILEISLLPLAYWIMCLIGKYSIYLIWQNNETALFDFENFIAGSMALAFIGASFITIRLAIAAFPIWINSNKILTDKIIKRLNKKD